MVKTNWYLDRGYSYITFSPVQDREWAQNRRKSLRNSLNYLVQILSAEKLRRVRILYFVHYYHRYYDIAVLNKMSYTPLATDALCPRRPMPYARESTSCY
jgi:hypothetical protein